jgi:hypothetical protein
MQAIVPADENFPALSGDFENDTTALIGELKVGKVVIERGWARFYLIWKGRKFLDATHMITVCSSCDLEVPEDVKSCPRCGAHTVTKEQPIFPTLEAYVDFIASETGKSRQTIFNRLGTYRRLCDEKGVSAIDVFAMHLISSGAARKLSTAEENGGTVTLVNNSWQDTIAAALSYDSKSEMLRFIRHDVMNEPVFVSELSNGGAITIYKEIYPANEDAIVEEYKLSLTGEWPEEMLKWLGRKINLKI